jgi:hypothetical protein
MILKGGKFTMKKEDLIALGLDEATAQKVATASGEELKGFIPKTRFDEINDAKKQLDLDIAARDKQLEDLKKSTGDAETLKTTIATLQIQNATDKTNYDAKVKQLQIDNAVEKALLGSKAKNIKAVKALLDLDRAELDGETVKGLGDQIKKLQETDDTKFLFDTAPTKKTFKSIVPGDPKDGLPGADNQPKSLADAVKMHFTNNE